MHGEKKHVYKVLVGKHEGKKPFEICKRRWEDNIKMVLKEMGYLDMDCIPVAQGRDEWQACVNTVLNIPVA
jgi:hypothetical protein